MILKKKIFDLSEINNDNNIFSNYYYLKCIQLSPGLLATSNNNITIWSIKENKYSIIKNIIVNSNIYDMILIDKDKFMCSSNNKNLIIYDINNYSSLKTIKNIDFRAENNSLFKVNDKYILINCFKGIGIFDIKSNEIIQYTEEFYSPSYTTIRLDGHNRIYISHISNYKNNNNSIFFNQNNFDNVIKIFVTEVSNGEIVLREEYNKFTINDTIKNILCFNKEILIFGNNKTYKLCEGIGNVIA